MSGDFSTKFQLSLGNIIIFGIRPNILGGEDPKERSYFGLKIELFHFSPKIW